MGETARGSSSELKQQKTTRTEKHVEKLTYNHENGNAGDDKDNEEGGDQCLILLVSKEVTHMWEKAASMREIFSWLLTYAGGIAM